MKNARNCIAVDVDGTLADDSGPFDRDKVGDPLPGAKAFLEKLRDSGCEILIYTVRCSIENHGRIRANAARRVVEAWLDRHDLPWDHVWMEEGKPHARAFVDDKAVSCRPMELGPLAYGSALARIEKLSHE
jgi:hypothetical protein